MNVQKQLQFQNALIKAALFDGVMMMIAVYFLISYFQPSTLSDIGLPVLFAGVMNVVLAGAAIALGAVPVFRTVMAFKAGQK